MDIIDTDEEKYGGEFDYFLNANGRQTWSGKGRDNFYLNSIRRARNKTGELSADEYAEQKICGIL